MLLSIYSAEALAKSVLILPLKSSNRVSTLLNNGIICCPNVLPNKSAAMPAFLESVSIFVNSLDTSINMSSMLLKEPSALVTDIPRSSNAGTAVPTPLLASYMEEPNLLKAPSTSCILLPANSALCPITDNVSTVKPVRCPIL